MDFGLETSNDTVKMATGNRALHQLRLVVFFSPIFLEGFIHPRWCRAKSPKRKGSEYFKHPFSGANC